ncbi:MAG: cobalt transporter [Candidatus Binatia bacterium]|nr:MAG: cobalt transporter [Candidatus Binatia bacterium]
MAGRPVFSETDDELRRAVTLVAILNLAYFGAEFTVATLIGSVSLYADSIDFLEDTAVNVLVLLALRLGDRGKAVVGVGLAGLLVVPGATTLWAAWEKLARPAPPDAVFLSVTGLGALAVNLFCAFLLARFRRDERSLTRAAFLSARNDALANLAIVGAGPVTRLTLSHWPDLLVGLGIFAINLDAAREVYTAARREHALAKGEAAA